MDFPFSFLFAKSCNGPVESPIRCNVTSLVDWVSTIVGKRRETKKKFWLPLYHWRCNLNKLSSRQRQTKLRKFIRKCQKNIAMPCPLSDWAVPPVEWAPASKRPRPMLPHPTQGHPCQSCPKAQYLRFYLCIKIIVF